MNAPRRACPAASTLPPTGDEHPATDSIAPTEFPKGWSAAREIGHQVCRQTSLHAPLEWRELAVGHALGRAVTGCSLPPRICLRMVAGSQSSTDSKRCLAAVRQQGFGSPFQAQAQPKRPLQRIGITLPEQGKKSEPAPDGVLTRVDVAGRHLGYGLCYHETRETREPTPSEGCPSTGFLLRSTTGIRALQELYSLFPLILCILRVHLGTFAASRSQSIGNAFFGHLFCMENGVDPR